MRIYKKLLAAAVLALLPLSAMAEVKTEAPVKMIQEMLYPTVMVDTGRGVGSGTLIFSGKRTHESWKEEKFWTLVLTNHHVVKDSISISKNFDPKKGKSIQKETRRPVHVRIWDYNDYSTAVGTTGRMARILAWDKDNCTAGFQINFLFDSGENIERAVRQELGLRITDNQGFYLKLDGLTGQGYDNFASDPEYYSYDNGRILYSDTIHYSC